MLVFDACPCGSGAVLLLNNKPIQYFTSAITAFDEVRYQYRIGDSRGQQAWEALSVLVALRLWRQYWVSTKVTLALQGDNVSALTLALKLKATTGAMKAIAREVALEFSESTVMPLIAQHIPGLTNAVADKLSRRYEPNAHYVLPEALASATEAFAPVRDDSYYYVPFHAMRGKRRRR